MIYSDRSKTYPTGIPQLQAYFRTILFDIDYIANSRLSSSNERFFQFAKLFAGNILGRYHPPSSELGKWKRYLVMYPQDPLQFELFFGDPAHESSLKWPPSATSGTIPQACEDRTQFQSFIGTVQYKTRKRRLFVTSRGYMGLGSLRVEIGDTICVLPGCDVPVIMRKNDGHYLHQGECFVLGIMDGEVMDSLDKGTVSLEEIEIH